MKLFFFYSDTTQRNQSDELEQVKQLFDGNVSSQIYDIPKGSLVIPRFRAIPFGKELEQEITHAGSKLINSWVEHRNIANLWNWVNDLARLGLTAPAYSHADLQDLPEGEWFVKGETNSIKNKWFDCCYAPTTKDLPRVLHNNWGDMYVGSQELVIRPFQRYRQIGEDVTGRPVFNERRCFIYRDTVLSYADYWTSFPEFKTEAINENLFLQTLQHAVNATNKYAPFRVIDLAEYPDGTWQIVELNDGCMSGLSDNNPIDVWGNLKQAVLS